MPTSIHIPASLLDRVSKKARAEGLSRNRYIVETLRRSVDTAESWPPEFIRAIDGSKSSRATDAAVDEMLRAIKRSRRSRRRPPF